MSQQAVTITRERQKAKVGQVSSNRAASEQEKAILKAFLTDIDKPRYGYGLHKETGVDHSTIYNLLLRLLEQGHLAGEWQLSDKKGRPKRLYTLTKEGLSYAAQRMVS